MYQALYRKWRPQVFDDVVGQDHITSVLQYQLENKSMERYITAMNFFANSGVSIMFKKLRQILSVSLQAALLLVLFSARTVSITEKNSDGSINLHFLLPD